MQYNPQEIRATLGQPNIGALVGARMATNQALSNVGLQLDKTGKDIRSGKLMDLLGSGKLAGLSADDARAKIGLVSKGGVSKQANAAGTSFTDKLSQAEYLKAKQQQDLERLGLKAKIDYNLAEQKHKWKIEDTKQPGNPLDVARQYGLNSKENTKLKHELLMEELKFKSKQRLIKEPKLEGLKNTFGKTLSPADRLEYNNIFKEDPNANVVQRYKTITNKKTGTTKKVKDGVDIWYAGQKWKSFQDLKRAKAQYKLGLKPEQSKNNETKPYKKWYEW